MNTIEVSAGDIKIAPLSCTDRKNNRIVFGLNFCRRNIYANIYSSI
jgi:hypothetical protein